MVKSWSLQPVHIEKGGCSTVHPDVDLVVLNLIPKNWQNLGVGEPEWLCNHKSSLETI